MKHWYKFVAILFSVLLSANGMAQNRGMILLKDSIEIKTTIDSVYQWFLNLNENFVR